MKSPTKASILFLKDIRGPYTSRYTGGPISHFELRFHPKRSGAESVANGGKRTKQARTKSREEISIFYESNAVYLLDKILTLKIRSNKLFSGKRIEQISASQLHTLQSPPPYTPVAASVRSSRSLHILYSLPPYTLAVASIPDFPVCCYQRHTSSYN